MKQQSSAATQMKKSNVQNLFVPQSEIDQCAKEIFGLVEQRAYQIYENRGREPGHDNEDWFRAISELLQPVTIELGDPGDTYVAVASVSGYRPEDLKISIKPRSLTICGISNADGTESGTHEEGSRRAGRFFFSSSVG
jgi:HSP20 family molecular chaperone IbpA